jgi:hypothetical protein
MGQLRAALLFLVAGAVAAAGGIVALAGLGAATIMFASGASDSPRSVLAVVPVAMMVSVGAMAELLPLLAPPAAAVGGVLWMRAVRDGRLRRRRAWAAAGALFGGFVLAAALTGALGAIGALLAGLGLSNGLLLADFILAGAAAGLMFRTTMAQLALFSGSEADLVWPGDGGSPGD